MDYKIILGILGILLTIAGYIPYIRDTLQGKTKPHIFSWLIWGILTIIIFLIQLENDAGFGLLVTFFTGISCLFIALIAYKTGVTSITLSDKVSFIGALISLVLWLKVDVPLYSVFLIILLDIFAFYPTIRKSWSDPFSETYILYFFAGVKFILAYFAINNFSLVNTVYPIFWIIMNFGFLLFCYIRIKQLKRT